MPRLLCREACGSVTARTTEQPVEPKPAEFLPPASFTVSRAGSDGLGAASAIARARSANPQPLAARSTCPEEDAPVLPFPAAQDNFQGHVFSGGKDEPEIFALRSGRRRDLLARRC